MYVCTYVYIYIHLCTCVYIFTYVHIHIYIYIYIHAYDPSMVDCDAHWWNINPTAVQKDQKKYENMVFTKLGPVSGGYPFIKGPFY